MMLTRCESVETVGIGRQVNQTVQNVTRESKSAMSLFTASDDKGRAKHLSCIGTSESVKMLEMNIA